MTHISRLIDSDGSLLAEKQDGRETVNNRSTETDSPLIAGVVVSESKVTQNDDDALVAGPVVSEEIEYDSGPLTTQSVVSSNPQYGNGVDEEPLNMPSVVS